MSYRSAIVNDRVVFFLSDTEIIELNTYDSVQKLVNASEDNLSQLIEEIKNNLISYANEELDLMQSTDNPMLTKTLAYAKIMQMVSYYFYEEERKKLDEEKRLQHEGEWSWSG